MSEPACQIIKKSGQCSYRPCLFHYVLSAMKNKIFVLLSAVLLLMVSSRTLYAQINVTSNQTALQLAQKLAGAGVVITNATLTCATVANGSFSVGPLGTNLGLDSGIILTSGSAAQSAGPQTAAVISNQLGSGTDADLALLSGQTIADACKLEFDFTPAGDTVKFNYVFGSEEYDSYSCDLYNDAFAFFISGPGITGQRNLALIPNTTIPITINSTTDPAVTMPTSLTACTNMGPGSPFAQYYVNNTTGTTVAYYGFTTIFEAVSPVTPCNTYHLKLVIGDGFDDRLDSGVWLKAGSLTSNPLTVTSEGSGGLSSPTPYAVRNCLPGKFKFTRPSPRSTPLTVRYLIQGSAVNGTDYTMIPDSIVIPANATTAQQLIYAQSPPSGHKQIQLKILSPYTCSSTGAPTVIDSVFLDIFDQIKINILTKDTTICRSESVQLELEQFSGDTGLVYHWTPVTGLSNPNIYNPIATPLVTTKYVASSSFRSAGCPTEQDTVTITVLQPTVVNAGPDITTCVGTPFTFNVSVSPPQNYTYSWTPGTYLSSTTVLNPTFTPTTPTPFVPYVITATPGRPACGSSDTILVRVLPNDFTLLTPDTTICYGATIAIRGQGDAAFTYHWSPNTGVNDPNILTPYIAPAGTGTQKYTVTGSFPGCPDMVHSLDITTEPALTVNAGPDMEKCQWETAYIYATVDPANFQGYSYRWLPDSNLNYGNIPNVEFTGQQDATLRIAVTTPIGCTDTDEVHITVHPGNFAAVTPGSDTAICPHGSVQITATGGIRHMWSPATYLSDTTIPNPVATPGGSMTYTDIVTDQFGCKDTLTVNVIIDPAAMISLPDVVTLYPGETYQVNPGGNCLYFSWFPHGGLDNPNVSNPIMSPEANTRYYVTASTETGCTVRDSMDIVRAESFIDMPNAFAPGSGPNNSFKPVYRGIVRLKSFSIYNRWGNKVFETSDINAGWDGRFNGETQPMGVYVYQIEAYTNSGKHYTKQGNVTMIR